MSARGTDGRVVAVVGSTGSGKTLWTRSQVANDARLLAWDPLGEWARELRLQTVTLPELVGLVRRDLERPAERFRYAYSGNTHRESFAAFCAAAWVWLRIAPGTLVVEELADVTQPGKAPPSWGDIVRKGRHFGARVYAITQRPAESDKTVMGNAAAIHCGLLAFPNDRKYLANCLDVPEAEIAALRPRQWIEKDFRTHELRRGTVQIPKGRARA